ncbi:hypothetical protein [Fibrella forsythiae]|uniref:Uncharacterized protein n=1 Tax=Fibrella forsythiae TaxID=2817061 RepID=A0ABS3JQN2_9BACT|nr:hypothetical protein [Fibrella forsythiae]MBO0952310.1 hypothetical protein [Fibrella forsythiae]
MQLQTLLTSLQRYLTIEYPYSVHVLYAATNDSFEAGYRQVLARFPTVQFRRERQQHSLVWPRPFAYWKNAIRYVRQAGLRQTTDFKEVVELVLSKSTAEGVMFLTDDSIFTHPVWLDAVRLDTVLSDPASTYSFSLRHGLTLEPCPTDIQQNPAGGYAWQVRSRQTDMKHWDWRFSVDGHVYPIRALLPILRRLHYANPNSLEGFVNDYIREECPDLFHTLLFDERPSLVGFILNKVQTFNGNRSFNVSPTYLNDKLLAGYKLTYRYETPVTDFQPLLTGITLTDTLTDETQFISIND